MGLGYLLFAELPDAWTWLGILSIAASGAFLSASESRTAARAADAAAAAADPAARPEEEEGQQQQQQHKGPPAAPAAPRLLPSATQQLGTTPRGRRYETLKEDLEPSAGTTSGPKRAGIRATWTRSSEATNGVVSGTPIETPSTPACEAPEEVAHC